MIDEELMELYSRRMKALGRTVAERRRLHDPDATVKRRGPLCGSEVSFDLRLDAEGKVVEIGYEVEACAVAAAAAALVVREAVGLRVEELRAIRDALRAMLREESEILPGGGWSDLEIFRPLRLVGSRHGSALLPFETAITAMEQAESRRRIKV